MRESGRATGNKKVDGVEEATVNFLTEKLVARVDKDSVGKEVHRGGGSKSRLRGRGSAKGACDCSGGRDDLRRVFGKGGETAKQDRWSDRGFG